MSGLNWYMCKPRDFNEGMVGLTMEERGAYATIVNLIYAKGGPIADDPVYFKAAFNCTARTWEKVRAGLLAKRRLIAVDVDGEPCLMDERAADEIEAFQAKSKKLSEAGSRGGKKSTAKSIENKHIEEASLEPPSSKEEREIDIPPVVPRGDVDPLKAFSQWNDLARRLDLPIARDLTAKRRRSVTARLREHGPEGWTEALAAIERSRFCRGMTDRPFRADFDFVCQAKSFQRLREGFYGADATPPPAKPEAWSPGRWRSAVEMFSEDRRWLETLGPTPLETGCRAPLEALREFGFVPPEGADIIPFERRTA